MCATIVKAKYLCFKFITPLFPIAIQVVCQPENPIPLCSRFKVFKFIYELKIIFYYSSTQLICLVIFYLFKTDSSVSSQARIVTSGDLAVPVMAGCINFARLNYYGINMHCSIYLKLCRKTNHYHYRYPWLVDRVAF